LLPNEYLVIKDIDGNEVDCAKWDGEQFVELRYKDLSTMAIGTFAPKDFYQKAAIDSLMTNNITMLRGKAGSGKSLLAFTYGLHLLEKQLITKIICFVNPVAVKDSTQLGYYSGSKVEKLLQGSIGGILAGKLGGMDQVENMIAANKLVLLPFSDIRGFESGDDTLVWATESQNLSVSLMKLALQRISEKSQIIIEGDDNTQIDSVAFSGMRNGMKRASLVFRGEKVYGEVTFQKIYRSKIAEIADKM